MKAAGHSPLFLFVAATDEQRINGLDSSIRLREAVVYPMLQDDQGRRTKDEGSGDDPLFLFGGKGCCAMTLCRPPSRRLPIHAGHQVGDGQVFVNFGPVQADAAAADFKVLALLRRSFTQ